MGHVLEKSPDGWTVLKHPAIADEDQIIKIGDSRIYSRNAGDILQPTREPLSILKQLRRDFCSDAFEAQYQQNPVHLVASCSSETGSKDTTRYLNAINTNTQYYKAGTLPLNRACQ